MSSYHHLASSSQRCTLTNGIHIRATPLASALSAQVRYASDLQDRVKHLGWRNYAVKGMRWLYPTSCSHFWLQAVARDPCPLEKISRSPPPPSPLAYGQPDSINDAHL